LGKKNSEHFLQLLKSVNVLESDILVSFDVVNLFTNVSFEEVLDTIGNKLQEDDTLAEHSVLGVGAIMLLLAVYLKANYLHVANRFYQQKEGMVMGSSLSYVVSNTFILLITLGRGHSEKLALGTAEQKPSLWLRYVDDTRVIWPHGMDSLKKFCNHVTNLIPAMKFIMEIEIGSANSVLDVLVIRE
jgi:hypothetical protein